MPARRLNHGASIEHYHLDWYKWIDHQQREARVDKVLALERVSKLAHLRPCSQTHVPLRRLILWCLFGMSGWWAYNSIMAELPIFVATLPGHERIGSVMMLCTQVGAVLTRS